MQLEGCPNLALPMVSYNEDSFYSGLLFGSVRSFYLYYLSSRAGAGQGGRGAAPKKWLSGAGVSFKKKKFAWGPLIIVFFQF